MTFTAEETTAWLEKELNFINTQMAATLNGRLMPRLHSVCMERKALTLEFPLQEWQVNGLGTLHGGISSAMMDFAMSLAVYAYTREAIPPTASMTTNYIRPIPMEGTVLIRTRLTSLGRTNGTAYCEAVIPSSGKVACTSVGTYAIVKRKKAE